MSDTIETQRGQVLRRRLRWRQAGNPMDLTGAAVTVRDAKPAVLFAATISIEDAPNGVCWLSLTEEQSLQLSSGRANWFRLEARWGDGANLVTPQIAISVK